MKIESLTLSSNRIIVLLCIYFMTVLNIGLWKNVFKLSDGDMVIITTMPIFIFAMMNLVLQLLFWPKVHRILMPLMLLAGAGVAYAVMVQGIYFDSNQMQNVLQTDATEAKAWMSVQFIIWILLAGILPAVCYFLVIKIKHQTWYKGLLWRLLSVVCSLAVVGILALFSYQDYASFFRNNRGIPHQIVPTNFLGAGIKTAYNVWDASRPFEKIGEDAHRLTAQGKQKNLFVIVVGETTRAQNWGLNPNAPKTTPQLAAMSDVINYPEASSCGTATAVSVPCMFSRMARTEYSPNTAKHQENLMDLLKRAGLYTSWRENDSGSKGVAARIKYMDVYRTIPDAATQCKGDLCYDAAMLEGLKAEIEAMPNDGVIVLHTNGSHGPAYFERYQKKFRVFTPTCDTNQIQNCSQQELTNTYNNTIVGIDDMLAQTINLLKSESNVNTALWYFSDHGESLGENGLYLHAAPYAVAPKEQTHIPMIFWASNSFYQAHNLSQACMKKQSAEPHSQDNLFHSVLGIMNIGTKEYKQNLDMFATCRQH